MGMTIHDYDVMCALCYVQWQYYFIFKCNRGTLIYCVTNG